MNTTTPPRLHPHPAEEVVVRPRAGRDWFTEAELLGVAHPCQYLVLHGYSPSPATPDSWRYTAIGAFHDLARCADYLTRRNGSAGVHPHGAEAAYGAYDVNRHAFIPLGHH